MNQRLWVHLPLVSTAPESRIVGQCSWDIDWERYDHLVTFISCKSLELQEHSQIKQGIVERSNLFGKSGQPSQAVSYYTYLQEARPWIEQNCEKNPLTDKVRLPGLDLLDESAQSFIHSQGIVLHSLLVAWWALLGWYYILHSSLVTWLKMCDLWSGRKMMFLHELWSYQADVTPRLWP